MGLFTPFAEEGLFPIAPNYFNQVELFEKCSWITDAIIGDCSYEVCAARAKPTPTPGKEFAKQTRILTQITFRDIFLQKH